MLAYLRGALLFTTSLHRRREFRGSDRSSVGTHSLRFPNDRHCNGYRIRRDNRELDVLSANELIIISANRLAAIVTSYWGFWWNRGGVHVSALEWPNSLSLFRVS